MIASWADRYVGIPFTPKGRGFDSCDCYGLLRLVYVEQFGVDLPLAVDGYDERLDPDEIAKLIAAEELVWRVIARVEAGQWVDVAPPLHVGDGVLMRILGAPIHMGVLVSDREVLHTRAGSNSMIERLDAPQMKRRVLGVLRHEAMA